MKGVVVDAAVTSTTVSEALTRLVEMGYEELLEEARRANERYVRAANARHGRASEMDYLRGGWHEAARMLAILGGLNLTEGEDLLDFIQALLSHLER